MTLKQAFLRRNGIMKDPIPVTKTIVRSDIDGCPVGFLFRGKEKDHTKEERYFSGMEAPLNHPFWKQETYLYIIEDEEGKSLENIAKSETTIITKDPYLTDYRVEAKIRQFIPGAIPNCDDEYCIIARNGLVFRMQDLRRYYQLCLEGYDRIILYMRSDYNRLILGEKRFPIDPTRYHHLIAEVNGTRIRCWCDNQLLFEAYDSTYKAGFAGIRVNSICRLRDIAVSTWDEGYQVYLSRLKSEEKKIAEIRERIPKAVVWKTYEVSKLGNGHIYFFRPKEDTPARMVVASAGEKPGLSLFDLEGNCLWLTSDPSGKSEQNFREFKFADVDGDGVKEIVSLWDGGISIHRSTDGTLIAWTPLPEPGPFDRNRPTPNVSHLYPANLYNSGHYDSVVLKDDGSAGGWTFWVFDTSLKIRWSKTVNLPPFGHNINIHDVNRDGREEILAGYHCYNGEGERIWTVEEARYWDITHGARHPDSVIAGELYPEGIQAAYASGGEGFVLVDASCGKVIAQHRVGHAQGIAVGKFDKDRPGHQILIGTRHENFGILCFFGGDGEPIGRFQPDYLSQGGPIVNWTGDGTEFVLMTSSLKALGMWDMYGNYVMDLKKLQIFTEDQIQEGLPTVYYPVDITGDPRDELAIKHNGKLFILTQDRPYVGNKIFAPIRNERIFYPAISFERWVDNL